MIKKDRIKNVATILFAANGIKNTKIEDIAKALNIAKGGFYYYYKNKEELLTEIMDSSVSNRREFMEELEKLDIPFNEKMKLIIRRRISLQENRSNLFLFVKILENGEINLTYENYLKRDQLLYEFLEKNKHFIKQEYQNEIEKIRILLSSGLTNLLLYLIYTTGIKVVDEKSYNTMIKRFVKIDIEREIEIFYNLYVKSILK